jgi:GNAT superfamily N-acetyltransferase
MRVEVLGPGTVYRLAAITRTAAPQPWVEEVEDFALGGGAAEVLRSGVGEVLLVSDGEELIGAAIHRPHGSSRAQLVAAFVLDHPVRGRGLAVPAFEAVLDHVHRYNAFILWLVHEDNEPMRKVSDTLCGEPELRDEDGYLMYVHEA